LGLEVVQYLGFPASACEVGEHSLTANETETPKWERAARSRHQLERLMELGSAGRVCPGVAGAEGQDADPWERLPFEDPRERVDQRNDSTVPAGGQDGVDIRFCQVAKPRVDLLGRSGKADVRSGESACDLRGDSSPPPLGVGVDENAEPLAGQAQRPLAIVRLTSTMSCSRARFGSRSA
jgi:hypothetical protein